MNPAASPFCNVIARLAHLDPRVAHVALDKLLDSFEPYELAAALYDWRGLHARPAQLIEPGTWSSYGAMAGRGWGKTRFSVEFAIGEILAGRARRLALVGQSEAKTIAIFVTGDTGFLSLTPPWLGAEWESSTNRIVFGNGATATVYTAQEPTGLRGPQHDLALATELASWPAATADEAMSNLRLGLRLGRGQMVWDSTPKRRNPLIRERLDLNARDPERHVIVRGRTEENEIHLAPGVVAEWRDQWGSTARAREELDGEFLDDGEDQVFKQAWIDRARRGMPERLERRIISIDPASTSGKRSDSTGVVDVGVAAGDVFVIANLSGKHHSYEWPEMVVDYYVRNQCDMILAETNRGQDMVAAMIRERCMTRGMSLVTVGESEAPTRRPGMLFYKPFTARGSKASRADAAAALVERGRVHFVVGDLGDLETRLCDFTGADGKPDDVVDALSAGVVELAGTLTERADPRLGFRGINEVAKRIAQPIPSTAIGRELSSLFRGINGGRI